MDSRLPGLILTGASGFVGRNFIKAASGKFRLFCIARRSMEEAGVQPGAKHETGPRGPARVEGNEARFGLFGPGLARKPRAGQTRSEQGNRMKIIFASAAAGAGYLSQRMARTGTGG